jgi:magnesium chelatase family protein
MFPPSTWRRSRGLVAARLQPACAPRVVAARELQIARKKRLGLSAHVNAALSNTEMERVAPLDKESKRLIEAAIEKLGLSARGFVKVLRVARTIADLEGEERVRAPQIAEAIQARLLDGQG